MGELSICLTEMSTLWTTFRTRVENCAKQKNQKSRFRNRSWQKIKDSLQYSNQPNLVKVYRMDNLKMAPAPIHPLKHFHIPKQPKKHEQTNKHTLETPPQSMQRWLQAKWKAFNFLYFPMAGKPKLLLRLCSSISHHLHALFSCPWKKKRTVRTIWTIHIWVSSTKR